MLSGASSYFEIQSLVTPYLNFVVAPHQGFKLGPRKRTVEDLEEPILFNSVHLCEAPGAFVTRLFLIYNLNSVLGFELCSSLNHALSVSYPGTTWTWLATTLNPHYEGNDLGYMINDDRYSRHQINELFG